jgi:hypothetical protein
MFIFKGDILVVSLFSSTCCCFQQLYRKVDDSHVFVYQCATIEPCVAADLTHCKKLTSNIPCDPIFLSQLNSQRRRLDTWTATRSKHSLDQLFHNEHQSVRACILGYIDYAS